MISKEWQHPPDFSAMSSSQQLGVLSLTNGTLCVFTVGDVHTWPLHCLLTFRILSEVNDLGFPIRPNVRFNGFLEVLRENIRLIFHIGGLKDPRDPIRCLPGPLTKFALRRFSLWGWRCSLGECSTSWLSDQDIVTTHFSHNWTENALVKVSSHCS